MPDLDEATLHEEEVTNEDDPNASPDDNAGGGEGDGSPDEFFLEADERHRYKTREDAIKAISESGRRISELAPWESEVGEAFGGLKPTDVRELLNELVELREAAKTRATAAQPDKSTVATEPARPTDPKVAAQEEANRKWLNENGYLTKAQVDEALKSMRDEVAALKQGSESAEQERFNHRVDEGETYVKSLATENKLSDVAGERAIRYITGCLSEANDPDGKLFGQFMRGGDSMRTVLKSLFDEFHGAITSTRANASSEYQRGKEKSANASKTLPKGSGGSGAPPPDKNAAKNLVQSARPDVHDRAWEAFQEGLE